MSFLGNFFVNTVRRALFPQAVAEREFGTSPAVSMTMEQQIALWYAMLVNTPPWQDCNVKAVGLPMVYVVSVHGQHHGKPASGILKRQFSAGKRELWQGAGAGACAWRCGIKALHLRRQAVGGHDRRGGFSADEV